MESPVHAQPQLFPNPIFRPGPELHTDVQVIGLIRRRADHVKIQPDRDDPGLEIGALHELHLGRHVHSQHSQLHLVQTGIAHPRDTGGIRIRDGL